MVLHKPPMWLSVQRPLLLLGFYCSRLNVAFLNCVSYIHTFENNFLILFRNGHIQRIEQQSFFVFHQQMGHLIQQRIAHITELTNNLVVPSSLWRWLMQKSSKKSRKGLLSGSLALDPVFEGSRNMGLGFQIVSDTFSGKDTFQNNFCCSRQIGPQEIGPRTFRSTGAQFSEIR